MKKSYQVMTIRIHLMFYTLLMYFYPIFPYHTFTDGTFNFDIVFLLLLLYFLCYFHNIPSFSVGFLLCDFPGIVYSFPLLCFVVVLIPFSSFYFLFPILFVIFFLCFSHLFSMVFSITPFIF